VRLAELGHEVDDRLGAAAPDRCHQVAVPVGVLLHPGGARDGFVAPGVPVAQRLDRVLGPVAVAVADIGGDIAAAVIEVIVDDQRAAVLDRRQQLAARGMAQVSRQVHADPLVPRPGLRRRPGQRLGEQRAVLGRVHDHAGGDDVLQFDRTEAGVAVGPGVEQPPDQPAAGVVGGDAGPQRLVPGRRGGEGLDLRPDRVHRLAYPGSRPRVVHRRVQHAEVDGCLWPQLAGHVRGADQLDAVVGHEHAVVGG
jgi:hypothetical protein